MRPLCDWFKTLTDRCTNLAVEKWTRREDLGPMGAEKNFCLDHALDSELRAALWESNQKSLVGLKVGREQVLENFDVTPIED